MVSVLRTRFGCLRKSAGSLMFLAVLLALAGRGYAVGLGEIRLDTALNERLRAEIPLIDIRGLDASELIVSLASNEDFARLGVERSFFLGDLRFEVEVSRSGVGVVRVTSGRPITEPYLNFLVQVLWPQGRLLKEYTLLLDPPTFSQAPAPVVSQPVQDPVDESGAGVVDRGPAAAPVPATRVELAPTPGPTEGAPAALDEGIVGDEYRMTDHSDTLWSIAQRARPSRRASIEQTMLAIQRLNPDAFLDNNINRLKAGMSLRLPSEAQVLEISAADATAQVAAQNQSWRAGVPVAQSAQPVPVPTEPAAIDATAATPARASEPADTEGRLRIMAGSGDSVTASADVEPVAEQPAVAAGAAAELAAALEERDRLSLEVSDLAAELERERALMAQQLAVKDRQLEVRDQQIAQMQAELARLREIAEAPEQSGRSQDQSVSGAAAPWWQAPGVMGAGAGVVVLLLAGGLVAARRRRVEVEPLVSGFPATAGERPAIAPAVGRDPFGGAGAAVTAAAAVPALEVVTAPQPEGPEGVDSPEEPVAAAPAAAVEAAAESEPGAAELADVIGEADIYLTYNRFTQAAELLEGALAEDPDRHDVRLKLLEVRERSGDRAAVEREFEALGARGADPEVLAAAAAIAGTVVVAGAGQPSGAEVLEIDALEAESLAFEEAPGPVPTGDALDLDLELFAETSEAGVMGAGDEVPGEPHAGFFAAAAELDPLEATEVLDAPEPVLPAVDRAELEIELELDELRENAAADFADLDDSEPLRADAGLLGGDLGIDFRLEEEDLEALDDDALALEMDGLPVDVEEGFDFADEGDSASTKLDLARAYSEMGDPDGAREILAEVLKEGTPEQQQAAQELLDRL